MKITLLGHSGFYVESPKWILLMDPWLSRNGAYEMAWFQYPRNHHLADGIISKIRDTQKVVYLYISHEHKDHFDPDFLARLETKKIQVIVPNFRRKNLLERCRSLDFESVTELKDSENFEVANGTFRIFIEDAELDRDSAILVQSEDQSFLNLNDCKIYDRIPEILSHYGSIDTFSAQFSGATWHPVCYSYEPEYYQKISAIKRNNKFKTLGRAISLLNPKFFIPSAGPACFLDPNLFHLNFEEESVFPRSNVFLKYLQKELKSPMPTYLDMFPGDTFSTVSGKIERDETQPRPVSEEDVRHYLTDYAQDYAEDFAKRSRRPIDLQNTLKRLQIELQKKLNLFPVRQNIKVPLYFGLKELSAEILVVNFETGHVKHISQIEPEVPYYRIQAEAQQILSVLDGNMNWEDFTLTFRARIDRKPDEFKTLMIAFLAVEAEDLPAFSEKWLSLQQNQKTIVVHVGGKEYEIAHFCPHQAADLTTGWSEEGRYWVCPKHGWKFDLENGGRCSMNASTISAKNLKLT